MSFFTEEEKNSLRISQMILHVVGTEAEFVEESAREVEYEDFFVARIIDTDVSPVFEFKPASDTKTELQQIALGAQDFQSGCQNLARRFANLHLGHVKEGAFFIFELEVQNEAVRIYSMIKLDYSEVIERQDADGLLRRIFHAFVTEKKAIQKSALVRVVGGVADSAVSARDRVKTQPNISDYFANFLEVVRVRDDHELNENLVVSLRGVLESIKDELPERSVAKALRETKALLRQREEINEDTIFEAIIMAAGAPTDEDVRSKIQKKTTSKLRSAKLEGLTFKPDASVLTLPSLRKVSTVEGITLTYPDDPEALAVQRERRPEGGEIITITTQQVVEDTVVNRKLESPS